MSKKVKWIIVIVLALFILGGLIAIALMNSDPGNGLPSLPDTNEVAVLGTAYETASSLTASDGTEYTVEQTEVYRISTGKPISLIYGCFDVTDILGYEIRYTATSGDKTVTQKHTLAVEDQGKPVLFVKGSNVASVGQKYAFPTVTVKDNSQTEILYTITVHRTVDSSQVAQESDGFVPDQVGYYDLYINAVDSTGNTAQAVFTVYARYTPKTTEIDAFDDEGLFYTAYAMSGKETLQAQFSNFRRLEDSKGSAYFRAGTGDNTAFYAAPRNDQSIMDSLGENGYISVWLYISTLRDSTKSVSVGNTVLTLDTNSWQEIRITKEIIGPWPAFFSKLESYSISLFQVINDGEDYTVFVDDVFAVKNNTISISGLNETMTCSTGDTVSLSTAGGQNVVLNYYYAGNVEAIDGSFAPEMDGQYLISAYNRDRTALSSVVVTVGQYSSEVKTTQWYAKGEEFPVPELNTHYAEERVVSETKTWLVDFETGNKTELSDTFTSDKDIIGLYSESVYKGKKTALFRFVVMNDTPFGTWFVTDDPICAEKPFRSSHINISWMEEFDGETGVLAVENTTGAEGFFNQQKYWKALYEQAHYKRCTKLVFKMKIEGGDARLSYIAESSWTEKRVTDSFAEDWQEYAIDFKDIYAKFSDFTSKNMFWTNSVSGKDSYTIYIADIYAVVENKLETQTIHQGESYDIAENPAFEGCEITECIVTKGGSNVNLDGTKFTAYGSGFHHVKVCGYDHMGLYFENSFTVNSVAPDVWYDFGNPKDAEVWNNGAQLTWLETYAGAEGVLKIVRPNSGDGSNVIGDTNGINWPAAYGKSHYNNAVGFYFRVKIESSASNALSIRGRNWKNIYSVYSNVKSTDGWQEFAVRADVAKDFDLLNGMFLDIWSNGATSVYVDQITVIKGSNVEEPDDMWYSFSDPFGASVWTNSAKLAWLESYEEADGVLKIERDASGAGSVLVGSDNAINWQSAFDSNHYANAAGLTFRVKIEGDASVGFTVRGREWKKTFKVFDGQTATDGWQDFQVKIDIAENYDLINGMFLDIWTSAPAIVYIDQITVIEGTEVEEPDDMWHSFSDSFGASVWTNGAKLSWLENYDDAGGVLKLERTSSGAGSVLVGADNAINWPAVFDSEHYANSEGLIFRVKVEGNASVGFNVRGREWKKTFKVFDGQTATDGWQEFQIKVDVAENYDLLNGMFFDIWTSAPATVYIDQITVIEGTEVEEPDDMWHSFSDSFGASVWTNGPELTWIESYEEANGVLKIVKSGGESKLIGSDNGINWAAAFDSEHYTDAIGLKFRIKIEGDALASLTVRGRNWQKMFRVFDGQGATNGWQEFTIVVDVMENYDVLNGMFLDVWSNGVCTIYIDQITVVKESDPEDPTEPEPTDPEEPTEPEKPTEPEETTEPENMWYSFSNSASANVWVNSSYIHASWMETYDGSAGILKIEKNTGNSYLVGNDNAVNWAAAFAKEDYEGATALSFRVKVEGNALASLTVRGRNWQKMFKVFDGQGATNGWQEFTIVVDVMENYDVLNGMFLDVWSNGVCTIYIDQITVVKESDPEDPTEPEPTDPEEPTEPEDPTATDNIWYGFDDASCASVWTNNTTNIKASWLECYEEANGVLKIEKKGSTSYLLGSDNGVNWPAALTKEDCTNAVGLTFKVKIEGTALASLSIRGRNWQKLYKVFDAQSATDGWQEYTIDVNVAEYYDILNGMFMDIWSNGEAVVYIDQITVARAYTVSFSDGVQSQIVIAGDLAVEPEDPIKEGSNFMGWYNGETEFDFSQPITADVFLTAKWDDGTADLWYSFNDASCASVWTNNTTNIKASWLECYEEANGVLKIEKKGSTSYLLGSDNGVNWPAALTQEDCTNAVGLTFKVKIEGTALASLSIRGRNWQKLYKVFDAQSATDGWQEYTIDVNVAEYYDILNGMFMDIWSNGEAVIYIDQITVVRAYTVSFSDDVASQAVVEGDLATEPEMPAKEGYIFLGWYDGDNKYDFTIPVTEDLSLIAKWEQEETVE